MVGLGFDLVAQHDERAVHQTLLRVSTSRDSVPTALLATSVEPPTLGCMPSSSPPSLVAEALRRRTTRSACTSS